MGFFDITDILRMSAVLYPFVMLMEVLSEKRKTSIAVLILSCLLFPVAVLSSFALFPEQALTRGLIQLISLFAITLNYKLILIKRVVALSSLVLFMNFLGYVITLLFGIFPSLFLNDPLAAFVKLIITILFSSTALLFRRLIRKSENVVDICEIWIPAFIISISMISFGILSTIEIPYAQELTNAFFFFGALVLCFYLSNTLSTKIENKLESVLHAQEKEYYFTQCQLMQASVENIKSIRHDMKFHLATAMELISSSKAEDARTYLQSLLGDIEKKEVYSNTKNVAFDSIINFKLSNAKQENVQLDIRLCIPPVLNINIADIVTIMGNLLDNALEAVAKVEEKIIKLDIAYSRESLFIQVENTFDGTVLYAKEANGEKDCIVTRKSGGGHGCGLKNIQKSVEKYNGYMDLNHEENVFSAVIFLYVNESCS